MKDDRRRRSLIVKGRLVPLMVIISCLLIMIGCIPIPSTRQFMMNGKFKPIYLVGEDASSPIQLGKTSLADARRATNERLAGTYQLAEWGTLTLPYVVSAESVDQGWLDVGGGRIAHGYWLRTATIIWPLCFSAAPTFDDRFIVLTSDERGIVTKVEIVDKPENNEWYGSFSSLRRAFVPWGTATTSPTTKP